MTMTRKSEPAPPSRYMTLLEVARELAISRSSVRDKVITGEIPGVNVAAKGAKQSQFRVPRAAFDAYCARLEAEAAQRSKGSAA